VAPVKWYYIVLLICVIIGPFDALYMYIKAEQRKETLKKRRQERKEKEDNKTSPV
jgi:hypothetical protein